MEGTIGSYLLDLSSPTSLAGTAEVFTAIPWWGDSLVAFSRNRDWRSRLDLRQLDYLRQKKSGTHDYHSLLSGGVRICSEGLAVRESRIWLVSRVKSC